MEHCVQTILSILQILSAMHIKTQNDVGVQAGARSPLQGWKFNLCCKANSV